MSFQYWYESDGLRNLMYEPSGGALVYYYTARRQLDNMWNPSRDTNDDLDQGPQAPIVSYAYDPNGNRVWRSYQSRMYETGGAHVDTDYAYDDANRLLTVDNLDSYGNDLGQLNYTYNSVGNRTRRQSTIDGPPTTDVYGYDAIDQITNAKYNFNSGTNTQDRQVSYNYDSVGNRSGSNGVNDSVNGSTSYTVNNLNQYTAVGASSPSYDGNGNLVSASVDGVAWSYSYDAQNRLVSATSSSTVASFGYDGRNRCVRRTINGATTYLYYDGWNLVEEQAPGNALSTRYIHGPQTDELIKASWDDNIEDDVFYLQDALGSTVALTDIYGDVFETYTYDVFGKPSSPSGFSTRFLFTGREYLSEVGLYDYRNRVYSPTLGRFLQTDPKGFGGGDLDLYRYVRNNPVNLNDPNGLQNQAETESDCLDRCIQFCGNNACCANKCQEDCANGELPNILSPLSDPTIVPIPAEAPTLWEKIVEAIWNLFTG